MFLPANGKLEQMSEAIENHGVIGDMRTVALIGLDATVDFLCWPRFDSPSVFAALLDDDRGGQFSIEPALTDARRRQLYLPDTNVLLTRFMSPQGVVEISDFMVVGDGRHQRLVRRVKAIRQRTKITMRCAPRFNYARASHQARIVDGAVLFKSDGPVQTSLRLRSDQKMTIKESDAVAVFQLNPGETAFFVLEDAVEGWDGAIPAADDVSEAFKATSNFWRSWVARSTYKGRWSEMVHRSALILKLLTSAEHGSIVAAPTFGLPEHLGGDRNWDYRYTWLRDAAFTVYAFLRLGFTEEANAFMRWLGQRASEAKLDGELPILYRVDGGDDLEEIELTHLTGYRGSVPVRIGNDARGQLQLDITGELLDAAYLADKYGNQLSWNAWNGIVRAIENVVKRWKLPDEGIWEVRSGRREHLHSRLMCWVALDRAIRLAQKRALPAPIDDWTMARDAVRRDIHASFWNEEKQSFVQEKNGTALDASCLLMPLVRFISATDPRWLSTMQAVSNELMDDSLIYRYSAEASPDGLTGTEGTFNMCSFWYIEALARTGDLDQARFLFEKMLGYANHLGLFAEETGPAGEHLGNFPQAFTHLALISAAFYLDRALNMGK